MQTTIRQILSLSADIRYVAVYRHGTLASESRDGLANASDAESDKYEELIVNPTLLTLLTQRGNIDCGGLEYVLIRYGSFFEFVATIDGGHVSVGIEPTSDPLTLVPQITAVVSSFPAGPPR